MSGVRDKNQGPGSVLVVLQFIALTIIAMHAGPALRWWPSALVIGVAGAVMVWALMSMGGRTFRVHPKPSQQGKLATGGLYGWLRHPMYAAVLAASLVITWVQPVWAVLASLLVVLVVLYLKIRIEEAALREKFPGYQEYAQRVPALVPFLPGRRSPRLRRVVFGMLGLALLPPTVWLPIEAEWDRRQFSDATVDGLICKNLSVDEARALQASRSDLQVLDVRSRWEAQGKRLPGAMHFAAENADSISGTDFASAADRLDRKRPVLIYCAGGFRSRLAVGELRALGFEEIYHLHRGILSWRLCGGEVEAGADAKTDKR